MQQKNIPLQIPYIYIFNFLSFFFFFKAAPVSYERSWARGRIRAAAAGLYHINAGSELHLRLTLHLVTMLDS